MESSIRQTLVDVVDLLDRAGAPFALIGGLAVAIRGEPRTTADVDLVVGIDVAGAISLIAGMKDTPLRPLFSDADDLVQRALLLPLRHRDTNIKVDLAIGLSGFEHQVIDRAMPVQIGDSSIPVATAEDLILMKVLAARPRDVSDAAGIVARQRRVLDWNYLARMANDLQEALQIDLVSQIERLRQP